MNSFKVSYSKKAETDLDRIYEFIANEFQNKNAAMKILRQLTKAVNDLSFMADSYHHFQEEPYLSEGVRYFTEGKFSIKLLMIQLML